MIYTIRDPITFGVMPSAIERRPRGLAKEVQVETSSQERDRMRIGAAF